MQLLSTVDDTFHIERRGPVIVLKKLRDVGRKVMRKEPIRLAKPDGTNIDTRIEEIELVLRRTSAPLESISFLLPQIMAGSDIPKGTEVWLLND